MRVNLYRRRYLLLWQSLLLVLGTSWLWAPLLNPGLSDRLSLISDFETAHQPYAWLFRVCDVLAGLLVLWLAMMLLKHRQKTVGWLMVFIGLCFVLDPLLPTTCDLSSGICQSSSTPRYIIHGIESVGAGAAIFITMAYDSIKRKKLLSLSIALLQVVYGIYFLLETVKGVRTHTVFQYLYETSAIAWLAWLGRDLLFGNLPMMRNKDLDFVKTLSAVWAFVNGVLAIIISLAHIRLIGHLKGLYFAANNAWLGQHGVIIGVVMLYLSRHLARGERRAWQIFLALVGIETLKYAVLTPNFGLLALYSFTFVVLFLLKDGFDRGTVPMTWSIRLKDLYYLLGGLVIAGAAALLMLDSDGKTSIVVRRTFNHFSDYLSRGGLAGHSHARGVLLAHTVSAFLLAAAVAILWVLFRPYKILGGPSAKDRIRAEALLGQLSGSTEDYFKIWPHDKRYFWPGKPEGFIAYKITGSAVFAIADPISPNRQQMINSFIEWARGRRLKVCFLPIYPRSLKLYEKAGLQPMQIGASAVIDIKTFISKTSNDKWWRWQKNRAAKSGYEFAQSTPPHSLELMRQLALVSDAWLKVGGHKEYGFALGHHDQDYLNRCQIYYLKDGNGSAIAFTNGIPQFRSSKTVTVDLLRYLPQFAGAMQFLLYKTIESEAGKYKYFDLGFVPFAKARGPIQSIARTLAGDRFSARGLEQFKNKFDPDWQPNYMAYDGDLADLATVALRLEQAMDLK